MNRRALHSFFIFVIIKTMKHIGEFIDFHFSLALIAVFGMTSFLYLQFDQADLEFDTLNSSIYSVVHGQDPDTKENITLNQQLDQLENEFEAPDTQDEYTPE